MDDARRAAPLTGATGQSASRARAAVEDVGALVGIGYIGQIATFILSVVLRRILGPGDVAWVALLGLAATYAPYLGLGTIQAAERLIALELGRGDHEAAADVEAAAGWLVGIASLGMGVAATLAVLTVATGADARRAIVSVVVTVVVQQVASLAIIRLRTRLRFRAVAVTTLATAILTSAGGVLGAVAGHLPGAIAGTVLGYTFGAMLLARVGGVTVRGVRGRALRRVAAGAPVFFALGVATVALYTLDQVIAGAALGATAFGLYSTAYLGNAFLVRIPANISSALFPRLQMLVGRGIDSALLGRHVERATLLSAIVVGPLVGAAIVGLPLALRVVLPAYAGAVPAMRLVLMAVTGLALAGPASQLLISIGRQWLVVTVTAIGVGLMLAGSAVVATAQVLSTDTIALVDCLTYLAFGAGMQAAMAAAVPVRRTAILQATVAAYGPAACALAAAWWLDRVGGSDPVELVAKAAAATVVLLIVWASVLAAVARSNADLRSDLATTRGVVTRMARAVIRFPLRGR
jgi:O-antigen/teichoic acid export membrane protein